MDEEDLKLMSPRQRAAIIKRYHEEYPYDMRRGRTPWRHYVCKKCRVDFFSEHKRPRCPDKSCGCGRVMYVPRGMTVQEVLADAAPLESQTGRKAKCQEMELNTIRPVPTVVPLTASIARQRTMLTFE